ncbi:phosphotransferase [Subtercola boreus]|uniref:Maltokinase n=1 Tax=Subtercola boreus TaxID=120213 RepID=A0A3E0VIR2_9MICO|nr:phosphotransferase [Subtercola boreus]RFA09539.1 phosphotransferase [Subtercola boreus]TQL53393.1 trehalose synthase-fused probable maltokinase [Subtercola boreus]
MIDTSLGDVSASDSSPFDNALLEALTEWMPRQRWFGGKTTVPALRLIGSFDLPHGDAEVRVTTFLVLDEGGQQSRLYQVPLTVRGERVPELESSLIVAISAEPGSDNPDTDVPVNAVTVGDEGSHTQFVYDGTHDLAYSGALLDLVTRDQASDGTGGATATGRAQISGHPLTVTHAKVLSGEQSNTSIIMTVTSAEGAELTPVICKVFRVLHHGNNPDVVLQSALAKAGSTRVPASIGSVVGQWHDSRMPDGRTSGHLAFAQEFLPGVEDAWRVALDAVESGRSFVAEAAALGEATAEVHETLASVLPTVAPSDDLVAGVMTSMRRRHGGAVREVPSLAEHNEAIERVFEAAEASPWPNLQRIHGDYHLGQVLHTPNGGWVLVDFEGEPLRPMVERSQPDLVLRDIAGMLRSFDYVAGSYAQTHPGESATQWALDARAAFLDAYIARAGLDLRANRALLDAFEIDKALYEAIYEVRNRPSWVSIPTTAVARLANRPRG